MVLTVIAIMWVLTGALISCAIFKAARKAVPQAAGVPGVHVVGAMDETESTGSACAVTATRVADQHANGVLCMFAG
jgi:hypothetical protein